jgi:hypothetical protein
MKGVNLIRAAVIALIGIAATSPLAAEKATAWIEPFSAAYGFSNGTPRIIVGAGFPFGDRYAIDGRAFTEWSANGENAFVQIKADALARWYAFGDRGNGALRGGAYIAGGIGIGYAQLDGQRKYWLLAAGPIAEAGWRISIWKSPGFVEPFIGYSLNGGPRFGEKITWNGTGGANAGLRFGLAF